MDGTPHLYVCSNCPTSVLKEFFDFTEFIDRLRVEKLECLRHFAWAPL